jgi:hypothetical protein
MFLMSYGLNFYVMFRRDIEFIFLKTAIGTPSSPRRFVQLYRLCNT